MKGLTVQIAALSGPGLEEGGLPWSCILQLTTANQTAFSSEQMSGASARLLRELPDPFETTGQEATVPILGNTLKSDGTHLESQQRWAESESVCSQGADCVYPRHVGEEMQCNSLMCVYSAPVGWPLITALTT